MALSTENVKTAEGNHFVVLGFDRSLRGRESWFPSDFVAFGVFDRVQSLSGKVHCRHRLSVSTKHDICSTASHICCDGHRSTAPSHGDDRRFAFVMLCIENLVWNTIFLEHCREFLRLIHTRSSDQYWLTGCVTFHNVFEHRTKLCLSGSVNQVSVVLPHHVAVCWDRNNPQIIDLIELGRLGHCGSGHTTQFVVESEEILQGDGRQGLILGLNLNAFFRLN